MVKAIASLRSAPRRWSLLQSVSPRRWRERCRRPQCPYLGCWTETAGTTVTATVSSAQSDTFRVAPCRISFSTFSGSISISRHRHRAEPPRSPGGRSQESAPTPTTPVLPISPIGRRSTHEEEVGLLGDIIPPRKNIKSSGPMSSEYKVEPLDLTNPIF